MRCYWRTQGICGPCFGVSNKLKKEVLALANQQDIIKNDILGNTKSIKEVKERMDKVEERVDKMNPDDIVRMSNETMFKELRDRESRKDSLVIHQLPEGPENLRGFEKQKHDVAKIIEIFGYLKCPMTPEGIRFNYRAGKEGSRPGPRPVVLGLVDSNARNHILANTRDLAKSELFKLISIIPDLTKQQRKEEDDLRKEAQKLNLAMEEEEALNWEWVPVGMKGQRKLIKRKKIPGRGDGPPRSSATWRAPPPSRGSRRDAEMDAREREELVEKLRKDREKERERKERVEKEKKEKEEKEKKEKEKKEKEKEKREKEKEKEKKEKQKKVKQKQKKKSNKKDEEEEEGEETENENEEDGDMDVEIESISSQDGSENEGEKETRKRTRAEGSLSPPCQPTKKTA